MGRLAVLHPQAGPALTAAGDGGDQSDPTPHRPDVALLGATDVRSLAASLDLRPSKARGQNFVVDPAAVRRVVRVAGVQSGDRVLEVGPGLGSLTLALLEAGACVVAVEVDQRLAGALGATVADRAPAAARRLAVLAADALVVDGDALRAAAAGLDGGGGAGPTRLVANLPYNVAVPVLLHLLAELPGLAEVLVMVQTEVAQRLAAAPGGRTYGVPSVKAAWYGDVTVAGAVPRGVFWPVPNVDSSLVRLRTRPAPGDPALREATFAVVDAAFSQRRKMLRSALAGWAGSPARAEALARAAGLDPALRGERLGLGSFVALARAGRGEGGHDAA